MGPDSNGPLVSQGIKIIIVAGKASLQSTIFPVILQPFAGDDSVPGAAGRNQKSRFSAKMARSL